MKDSEIQAITAPPLISTIDKSPEHPLNLFPAYCVISSSLATVSNSGDSSASRAEVLSSQPSVKNSLTTQVKVKVKVTLRLTVGQSISLGVEPHLGLMTRYLLLFESYCLVFVGRPL
jgi:hypothetical protein